MPPNPAAPPDPAVADLVFRRVCRTDLSEPGWHLLNLGADFNSPSFRRWLLELVAGLSDRQRGRTGAGLAVVSAGRFDQQTTTRPHLDGGPEQSLLVLGYEPTAVASSFTVYDLARFAADLGVSPAELLERHNPMFAADDGPWRPYAAAIPNFDPATYRVVVVNNTSADPAGGAGVWRGVLHAAAVPAPDFERRRAVNSLMLAPARLVSAPVSPSALAEWAATTALLRRGPDRPDDADDG